MTTERGGTRGADDSYHAWERAAPRSLTDDPLWRLRGFRLALYAADVGWQDAARLQHERCGRPIAEQLVRALGSVAANLAEGYCRGTGADRARSIEYALGSARESRVWYHLARHTLGDDLARARLELLSEVVRMLIAILPMQRRGLTTTLVRR